MAISRALIYGVFALVIAALAEELTQTLDVFSPCRVLYRTHVPVLDSPACVTYQWINLGAMMLLLAGIVLFGGSIIGRVWRRKE